LRQAQVCLQITLKPLERESVLAQNVGVLQPRNFLFCLLMLAAGCATPRRGADEWNAETAEHPQEITQLAEVPALAPPPQIVPPAQVVTQSMRANVPMETWVPLKRWSAENGTSLRRISGPVPTFALKMTNGLLVLRADNFMAEWNGMEFYLGFRPQLINGQPFIHTLDLVKNIRPLLSNFSLSTKTNCVIVIDPGHGGVETGTISILDGSPEKEFNLDWAKRLQPLLETNGWQVFLTRTNDTRVSLASRVAFAEEHKADLFISLHFNASPSPTNRAQVGLETYCLTPRGMPSTLTRDFGDDTTLLFPNNAFDFENWQLAFQLHHALLKTTGAPDHGVRHARFMGVLRGQNRPAVLIEGGYLSNAREARRIADPAYRQKLAEAVAQALTEKTENRKQKAENDHPGGVSSP
jgi:N-acetylmuramoyl-L-alanine amidase